MRLKFYHHCFLDFFDAVIKTEVRSIDTASPLS